MIGKTSHFNAEKLRFREKHCSKKHFLGDFLHQWPTVQALCETISQNLTTTEQESKNKRSEKKMQSMMGLGIAIGAGIGVALGVALDNIGLGVAVGIGAGVAIGAALGQQSKQKDESNGG